MDERAWFNYLDDRTRIRSRARFNRQGGIEQFTLQLEHCLDDRWLPVVRFDSAHGEAHIDYIDPKGQEYHKVWLGVGPPYNQVFTLTEVELKTKFSVYVDEFLLRKR
ncbi:MAG: DUF7718 family protein [Thermomicrobiales bacterium]|jgi:hypothetical protein